MLEKKDIMDQYQILTELKNDSSVLLVKNLETDEIQVMKYQKDYNIQVIRAIKEHEYEGIPKISYLEEEDGYLLTIEEYIHGRSLKQICGQKGLLSEEEVLTYFLDLCGILKNLHNADPPIVHRDIKPDNIILTNDQVIKLIDFNGSKEEKGEKKQDTVMFGTHEYAAPEQYGFGRSDHRTDIYQIGVTMNELLTGQYPIHQIYQGDLGEIIRKCTEYDKEKRYSSVEELEGDLRKNYEKNYLRRPDTWSLKDYLMTGGYCVQEKPFDSHTYLPPGFRSRTPWKMVLAAIVYLAMVDICATMEIRDSTNQMQQVTGIRMWTQRGAALCILIVPILIFFNYKGVLGKIPIRNKLLKVCAMILLYALFLLLVVVIISIADHLYMSAGLI